MLMRSALAAAEETSSHGNRLHRVGVEHRVWGVLAYDLGDVVEVLDDARFAVDKPDGYHLGGVVDACGKVIKVDAAFAMDADQRAAKLFDGRDHRVGAPRHYIPPLSTDRHLIHRPGKNQRSPGCRPRYRRRCR